MIPGDYRPFWWAVWNARQLLYPRRCPFCGQVLGSIPDCSDCRRERERLRRLPSARLTPGQHYLGALSGAAAPFRYGGCVRRGILRAKYAAAPWAAVELGLWMARLLFGAPVVMRGAVPVPGLAEGFGLGYDCIVPVPASGRGRGYNVPEQMARPLAHCLQIPLEGRALLRVRRGPRQAGLSLEDRLVNVAGAFQVRSPRRLEGRRVLLVDDVITTGATAAACAQALLEAGAASVFAVAMATGEGMLRPSSSPEEEENRDAGTEKDFFEKDGENP